MYISAYSMVNKAEKFFSLIVAQKKLLELQKSFLTSTFDGHNCSVKRHGRALYTDASFCVSDSCQKNGDCPDVDHITHGLIKSKGCDKGTCVYKKSKGKVIYVNSI